ncbi:MAG: hypothetical protein KF805_17320, partial [Phycisphaeraceae bacterium]|nr:hypothetical protein [Phycisphaeraceae bacterium]
AIGLAAVVSAGAMAGDIANFGVSKRGVYKQTDDNTVEPDGFDINFRVSFWTDGAFEAGTVLSPAFASPVTLQGYDASGLYAWDGYFSSQAELESSYPASMLTFSMSGGFLPPEDVSIELVPSLFCVDKPQFVGDTFSRLHAVDPAAEFSGTIAPCTVEGDSTLTYGTFFIVDLSNGDSVWYQSFQPGEDSFTIPAGTIPAGRAFIAVLSNENRFQTPNAGFGGAIAEMIFTQETQIFFNTRGPCPADLNGDGVVDDADFSLFAQAYNALACTSGTHEGCPADLTNDGVVVDDDFVVFVVAYNELLCP